jgi:hypothetical protein
MYLGVDAWQSPNGFDILGVVLYRLCDGDGRKPDFEAMPLDFVKLSWSHMGEYLAETVQLIVEKFEIQNKVSDFHFFYCTLIKTDGYILSRYVV